MTETEMIKINQYELSEVVEARVTELLKLAKKSINNLTNRKISYIIVTGSITELTGFSYVVENVLGMNSSTLNITTLGIRNNKFSSTAGIIKYFNKKMELRDKIYEIEEYVFEKISNVMATMHGKNNAFTIKSLTDLATLFGIEIINIEDSYTVATNVITYNETQYTLKNGDVFYVVDTNVPDYWFSKDDYKLYKMETTKVDLSQYALITKVDEKNLEDDIIYTKKSR